jgi:putative transposase
MRASSCPDIWLAKRSAGLIVQSDQGSLYTATRFKDLIAQYGAQESMNRRGNCYDNAHANCYGAALKPNCSTAAAFHN